MLQKANHKLLSVVLVTTIIVILAVIFQIFFGKNTTSFPLNLFNSNMRTDSIIFSLEEDTGRDEKIYVYKNGEIIVRAFSFDLRQTIYKTKTLNEGFDLNAVLQIFDLDISNLPAPGEYGKDKDEEYCISAVYPFSYKLNIDRKRYSLLVDGCNLDGFSEDSTEQILLEFIRKAGNVDISGWNDWTPNLYKVDFENFGCSDDDFHEAWPEQLQGYSFHHTNYIDSSWNQSKLFQLEQHRNKPGSSIFPDVCYWVDIDGAEDYYKFDIEPLFPHEEESVKQEYDIKQYRLD